MICPFYEAGSPINFGKKQVQGGRCKIDGGLVDHDLCEIAAEECIVYLRQERDRYLALLQEIATAKNCCEQTSEWTVTGIVTLESIQRHVRQQLEQWGIALKGASE